MDLILVKLCFISALAQFVYSDPLKWVVTGSRIPVTLSGHSAVYDGRDSVYLIGGGNGTYNGEVYKYSIRTAEVESVGTFPGRAGGVTAFHNNDIYYLGGSNGQQRLTNITKFSTLTSEWEHVNDLPIGMNAMASAWDPLNKVLYTFGGYNGGYNGLDQIYKYNPGTNEVVQVGVLPEETHGATAVWENSGDMAYIFGGISNGSYTVDIFEFNANTGNVTKLSARLPQGIRDLPSIMANGQNAYIIPGGGLIKFNPESGEAVSVEIDTGSWPRSLEHHACVYLPHLDRIYVYGGYGGFPGESLRYMNKISYVELDSPPTTTTTQRPPTEDQSTPTPTTESPPTEDCSDGLTKTIRDPFCCCSFYFCHTGRPTKYECVDGEQFNPTTLQCEDANIVKCGLHYA